MEVGRARSAAGALFVRGDEVLLVHKTYGNGWDLPGGYVEPGEAPTAACRREIGEELGIDRVAHRLLVHDWAPNPGEGDKVLYVFECGELGDERAIRVQESEIDGWRWVAIDDVADVVIPRLARRVRQAHLAHGDGRPRYLEHGRPLG
ncbi:NUDIX domain-containing protein [Nocardia sp. NPDC057455]|uniref:NUDIX domain-containing protein n=1 Tax=Nocardia sp. NPDC057455 TaxID=3346138 RepID=UPI00366D0903